MTHKQNPFVITLKTIGKTIKHFFKAVWSVILVIANLIKSFFVAIEKALKIIAIFIIAISASVLFMATSFYLMSAAFGLKDSPAFKEVRDRATQIFSLSAKEELNEMEARVQAEIKADQEAKNKAEDEANKSQEQ